MLANKAQTVDSAQLYCNSFIIACCLTDCPRFYFDGPDL